MEDCDEDVNRKQADKELKSHPDKKLSQNTNDGQFSFHLEVFEDDEDDEVDEDEQEQSGSSADSSRLDIETENDESTEPTKNKNKRYHVIFVGYYSIYRLSL